MPLTILFDLDDTLLQTNMTQFLPAYFNKLGQALSHIAPQKEIRDQIYFAVKEMSLNQDPARSLNQIFADHFYPQLGTTEEACRDALAQFYAQEFPKLRVKTKVKPEAQELVNWCLTKGFVMAIATNPLFPERATKQRIKWAGLNPENFVFFSHYDNFHFTKPNLSYYAECMGKLGWPEQPALMIGDNLERDLIPVEKMGLMSFWITDQPSTSKRGQGSLKDAWKYTEAIDRTASFALKETFDVQLAILRATPAILDTWLKQVPRESFLRKPAPNEWSILEVFWHLADYENEIFNPQWEQIQKNPKLMLTHREISRWADERDYQSRDPKDALALFLEKRKNSLMLIEMLYEKGDYERSVQHTIFSKTTVAELTAFAAKHDRLHLQQIANLVDIYKIY